MSNATSSANGTLHIPSLAADLPSDWQWRRLDEACEGVFDCPHSTPVLTTDGPFVVRTQDVMTGTFRSDQAARVSEETYQERIGRAEPQYGDLLYSREGTYFGVAAEVPKGARICLGQRMVLLRPRPKEVYTRYLKYWLNSPILAAHVHGQRDGTVAERLNMPTIRALPVPVPPIKTQREIGDILGTLDDKIELNRRMNETLEAMARRLFKSWFVDFDPIHAKAAVRRQHPDWPNPRVTRTALPNLDPKIADLFPDAFEDSTLGPIPKGWRAGTIGNVARINAVSRGKDYPHTTIRYVDISSVTVGRLDGVTEYDAAKSPSRAKRMVQHGDTIWSCVRPNRQSFLFIQNPQDNIIVSTGFAVLTPVSVTPCYLYAWVTTSDFVDYLTANADGSAYPAVRPEHFERADILIPGEPVLAAFESICADWHGKIDSNERESRTLAQTRDKLLPKLLSGEVMTL